MSPAGTEAVDVLVREIVARDERGVRVARLWLDDRDGRGCVVLMTYDRAWTHCWSVSGRDGAPLAHWLSDRSGIEYVARKMGASDWFDREATIRAARRLVCRDRRDGCLDHDEARELFDGAEHLTTEADATGWFHDYCRQSRQSDTWEDDPTVRGMDPEFRRAWDLLRPALQDVGDALQGDDNGGLVLRLVAERDAARAELAAMEDRVRAVLAQAHDTLEHGRMLAAERRGGGEA